MFSFNFKLVPSDVHTTEYTFTNFKYNNLVAFLYIKNYVFKIKIT